MSISHLPNELLLELFIWLPLPSLLAVLRVSRKWHHLAPLSRLLPPRQALLALFTNTSESDRGTYAKIKHYLKDFDREAYLVRLTATLPANSHPGAELPEEFRLWVLEWPAIPLLPGWAWPDLGLPSSPLDVHDARKTTRCSLAGFDDLCSGIQEVTVYHNVKPSSADNSDETRCKGTRVHAIKVCKGVFASAWLVVGGAGGTPYLWGTVHAILNDGGWRNRVDAVSGMERCGGSSWVEWLEKQAMPALM